MPKAFPYLPFSLRFLRGTGPRNRRLFTRDILIEEPQEVHQELYFFFTTWSTHLRKWLIEHPKLYLFFTKILFRESSIWSTRDHKA
jgi:hypothetical protein